MVHDAKVADDGPMCRLCLEQDTVENLISPCKCSGTQRYVHLHCLQSWQRIVLQEPGVESKQKASMCGVCRTPFSTKLPLSLNLRWNRLQNRCLEQTSRFLPQIVVPCVGTIFAVLIWNIQGGDDNSMFVSALLKMVLAFVVIQALLHCLGLQPVLHTTDGHTRFAFIRFGRPVPGLRAGTFLVASEQLSGSMFRRSVMLLTDHIEGQGTRGYILNHPIDPQNLPPRAFPPPADLHPTGVECGVGGPVSMHTWEVIHSVRGVNGSTEVVPGVFRGADFAALAQNMTNRGDDTNTQMALQCKMLWGHAGWSAGQLAGEIRSGSWDFLPADAATVFDVPAERMWEHLQQRIRGNGLNQERWETQDG